MGFESLHGQDGNIEKPRTLKEYLEAVKAQIEKQDKRINESRDIGNLIQKTLELKDEYGRFQAFVDWKGSEVLDQPIGPVIDQFQEFIKEHEDEYKEKFGGKKVDLVHGENAVEAGDLISASDTLGKMVDRMSRFEQGQLY